MENALEFNQEDTHCYIGVYESDDGKSRKSCQMVLLFGHENDTRCKATKPSREFDWKYVSLMCPHCEFTHVFKRSGWVESVKLPFSQGMFDEGEF